MSPILIRILPALAAGVGLYVCVGPAVAKDAAVLDRVFVSGAISVNETEIGADQAYLDVAREARLDESIWKAGATLGDSHRVQATFWKVGNVYRGITTEPATMIGGGGYFSGAAFSSAFDVRIETLSYTWFPLSDAGQAFGIGVGASRIRIDTETSVIVEGFPGDFEIDGSARERVTLPQVRAEYARLIGEWRFGAEASVGRKTGGQMRARSTEANVSLEYLPVPLAAIGVRYSIHRTQFEPASAMWLGMGPGESESGNFRIRSATPELYITLRY